MTDVQLIIGIPYAILLVCVGHVSMCDALFDLRVRRRKRVRALAAERARLLSVLATRSMQRGPYR